MFKAFKRLLIPKNVLILLVISLGQRGAKRQPSGGLMRFGMLPGTPTRSPRAVCGVGIERNSPCVYG